MRQFRVLSLFSGGMGLDLGLESTGHFEIIACIEKEKAFCDTIRTNIASRDCNQQIQVIEADISKLDPEAVLYELGIDKDSIDIIVGGPPCQSFSTAGRRGTTQDPRGSLLWDFLRFVEYIKPKMFLMENVRGLLSAALNHRPIAERPKNGGDPLNEDEMPGSVIRLFAEDVASFADIKYHLDIFEVNSVNYGAPQIRERVLIIGNCYGKKVDFPKPTHGSRCNGNLGEHQQSLFDQELLPWKTLGDALHGLVDDDPVVLDFSPRKKSFLGMVPPGSNWRSLPVEVQQESMGRAWYAKGGRSGWWRRLSFDLPSPTLVTMPNHSSTSLCHPTKTRALSIKEYARIQEFPDSWKFCGTLSKQYAQVGNAVPVRLGKVSGMVIAKELRAILRSKSEPATQITSEPRIIYLQSHIRTRRWFKDGEAIVRATGSKGSNTNYTPPKTVKRVRSLRSV